MICEFRMNGKYELHLEAETEDERYFLTAIGKRATAAGSVAGVGWDPDAQGELIVSVAK